MKYVLQSAHKSLCPRCNFPVALLCEEMPNPALKLKKVIWFYICFRCEHVAQVGVGPVEDIRDEKTS